MPQTGTVELQEPFVQYESISLEATPREALRRLGAHDHLCLIHESRDEQLNAVVPFIETGLARGEQCIYVTEENTPEDIINALRSAGLDVDSARQTGALRVLNAEALYLVDGIFQPDAVIDALAEAVADTRANGFTGLRIAGEMTWALASTGAAGRLLEYETRLCDFFARHDVLAICQYNRRRFDPALLRELIRTHPMVVYDGRVCRNIYYVPPVDAAKDRDEAELDRLLGGLVAHEKAAEEITAGEIRNFQLIDRMGVAVYSTDAEGRITQFNEAAAQLWGRRPVIGKDMWCGTWQLRWPDGRPMAHEECPMAIALKEDRVVYGREAIAEREDGSRIWFTPYPTPVHDADGQLVGGLNVLVDITAQKEAEIAARESEQSFRSLIEGIGVAVYTTDAEGCITLYNEAAATLWGRHPRLGIDRWCGSLRMRRQDGNVLPHDECPMALAIKENRPIHGGEAIIDRPDGTMVWVATYPTPLRNASNRVVGAVNVFIDVTRRKLAEEEARRQQEEAEAARMRYVDLVQGLDAIVWEANAETFEFTFVSQRAEELLGYPVDQWLSEPRFWADHIYHDDRDVAVQTCLDCTRSGVNHELEYRMITRDGKPLWLRDIVHVVKDEEGRASLLRGIMVDITARMQAEEELRAASALKDQFLGLVSHELRTPISTVIANSLILLRNPAGIVESDRTQALEDIANEGRKLQEIIEKLLLLTRLEASNKLDLETLRLGEAVQAQVRSYQRRKPGREIKVIDLARDVMVEAQPTLIGVVLDNLVGNADKYSPDAAPIEVQIARAGRDTVVVRVRDNGIGIAEGELEGLFTPFYRTATARSYSSGMGLGLAVSKRIVEAHGGRIWAGQRGGQGAEFNFELPVVPVSVTPSK